MQGVRWSGIDIKRNVRGINQKRMRGECRGTDTGSGGQTGVRARGPDNDPEAIRIVALDANVTAWTRNLEVIT